MGAVLNSLIKDDSQDSLIVLFWRKKKLLITSSLLGVCAFLVFSLSLPNTYKSSLVLVQSSSSNVSGPALSGQLGGLASFAGISIGKPDQSLKYEALEIIQSWKFIEDFILNKDIAAPVYAANGWNPKTGELIYDGRIYDEKFGKWVKAGEPPTSWQLYKKFISRLDVSESKKSGFVTVSLEYYSPSIAKAWLDSLVEEVNSKLRTRDKLRAEQNMAYLYRELSKTSVASVEDAIYGLIEEQMKTLMLAQRNQYYVFRPVSEAMVPEVKSNPRRALWAVAGGALGFIFAACFLLVSSLLRSLDISIK